MPNHYKKIALATVIAWRRSIKSEREEKNVECATDAAAAGEARTQSPSLEWFAGRSREHSRAELQPGCEGAACPQLVKRGPPERQKRKIKARPKLR